MRAATSIAPKTSYSISIAIICYYLHLLNNSHLASTINRDSSLHMLQIPWLEPNTINFPDTYNALEEPNGLLAAGGKLSPEWLISAYSNGIFPWFSEGEPILWWSPSPRSIIYINQLHVSKSLSKLLKKCPYQIRVNSAFEKVIQSCSAPRKNQPTEGSWITEEMMEAYCKLHRMGHAHSVEVWSKNSLVGGLYGIAIGRVFFGESMFSIEPNGSKIALFYLEQILKQWQYIAIDCQVHNTHLESMGAIQIQRCEFENILEQHVKQIPCHWQYCDIQHANIDIVSGSNKKINR